MNRNFRNFHLSLVGLKHLQFILILFFLLSHVFINGMVAFGQRMGQKEGVLDVISTFYKESSFSKDSSLKTSLSKRKWFKDSLIIEELRVLKIKSDRRKPTENYDLSCYIFRNLKTGKIYEFLHFSDTAKPVFEFRATQTVLLSNGHEYSSYLKQEKIPANQIQKMSDTSVNGVFLKRLMRNHKISKTKITDVYYLRCDFDKFLVGLLDLGTSVNNYSGCIAVKMERKLSANSERAYFSTEMNLVSTSLNNEQMKVFEAWENNTRENPVQ